MLVRSLLAGSLLVIPLAVAAPARADDAPAKEAPAGASAVPAEETPELVDDSPLTRMPAGSPADQALWTAAREVNATLPSIWRSLTTLQGRIANDRVMQRLDAASKQGSEEEKAAAAKARSRLELAYTLSVEFMTKKRTVDQTRACGYPFLNFATAMGSTKTEEERQILATSRLTLKVCVENGREMSKGLAASYQQLEAARVEAERVLQKSAGTPPDAAGPR
jgi:hypothetical protein